MDFKAELIKLQHHCLVNRNYLMNSEGEIDKGARSVYQEIRVKIMEIFELAEAESTPTSQEQLAAPAVINWLPLKGKMVDVLNKTYKRLLSKEPTRL